MAKVSTNDLSLRDKGCTGACCKKGSPFVLPAERDKIIAETGRDYFVSIGSGYQIAKIGDRLRDLATEACPFLNDSGCELQQISPDLKPLDCTIHPVFPVIDTRSGEVRLRVSQCCDACSDLPAEFTDNVLRIIENQPPEVINAIAAHQDSVGFEVSDS